MSTPTNKQQELESLQAEASLLYGLLARLADDAVAVLECEDTPDDIKDMCRDIVMCGTNVIDWMDRIEARRLEHYAGV